MNTEEYQTRYGINPEYIDEDGDVYDQNDLAERYDDMLDEMGLVEIAGLDYAVSRALQAVDPIAYRCGMSDYADALGWDEWHEDHEWNTTDEDEDESCEDCAREDRPLFVGVDGLTYCDRHIESHED